MSTRSKVVLLSALVALCCTSAASARAEDTAITTNEGFARAGFYLGVSASYAQPLFNKKDFENYYLDDDYDEDELDVKLGDGWGWGATAGYRVLPYLAVEAQYERVRNIDYRALAGDDRKLRIQALTTNVKLIAPTGRAQAYLLAGIGFAKYDLKGRTFFSEPFGEGGWALAGRIGGGLDVYLSENIVLSSGISVVLTKVDIAAFRYDENIGNPHYLSINTGLQYRF